MTSCTMHLDPAHCKAYPWEWPEYPQFGRCVSAQIASDEVPSVGDMMRRYYYYRKRKEGGMQ